MFLKRQNWSDLIADLRSIWCRTEAKAARAEKLIRFIKKQQVCANAVNPRDLPKANLELGETKHSLFLFILQSREEGRKGVCHDSISLARD